MSSRTKRMLHFPADAETNTPTTGGFVPVLKPFFIPFDKSRKRQLRKQKAGAKSQPSMVEDQQNYQLDLYPPTPTTQTQSQTQTQTQTTTINTQQLKEAVQSTLTNLDSIIDLLASSIPPP